MKITIVSNVILNLVSQKLSKKSDYSISTLYGDVVSLLYQKSDFADADFLFVHVDTIFQEINQESISHIINAINNVAAHFKGYILVSTIFDKSDSELKSASSHYHPAAEFSALKKNNAIFEFDFLKLLVETGIKESYNYASGFLYQMPYKKPLIEAFSSQMHDYIQFLSKPEKKVIITDADNTLWGGILGEDGIENLKVNKNADGILFLNFQKFLKKKKEQGFLLVICSKNNHDDVKEAFQMLDMPLSWDDFIVTKINWQPKIQNINELEKELNLGRSSFIFIDDNAFEIESVSNMSNNEITCFRFDNDYDNFLKISENFAFKRKKILDADLQKHEQYIQNQERETLKNQSGGFEAYINSLEIQNTLGVNDLENISRISQMTEKTNQFNFNKAIFTENQIIEKIDNGDDILTYSSKDKFGDYGIIGLAILSHSDQNTTIENLLMSCRALGKGVEMQFYDDIINFVEKKGNSVVEFTYKSSEKNQLAADYNSTIRNKYFDGKKFRKTTDHF